jgi:hypothetical protein
MAPDSALQGFSLQMTLLAAWSITWLIHHGRRLRFPGDQAFHGAGALFQILNLGAAVTKWLLTQEVTAAAMPMKMLSNAAIMAGISVLAHAASRRQPAFEAIRLHSGLLVGFDLAVAAAWAIALA